MGLKLKFDLKYTSSEIVEVMVDKCWGPVSWDLNSSLSFF